MLLDLLSEWNDVLFSLCTHHLRQPSPRHPPSLVQGRLRQVVQSCFCSTHSALRLLALPHLGPIKARFLCSIHRHHSTIRVHVCHQGPNRGYILRLGAFGKLDHSNGSVVQLILINTRVTTHRTNRIVTETCAYSVSFGPSHTTRSSLQAARSRSSADGHSMSSYLCTLATFCHCFGIFFLNRHRRVLLNVYLLHKSLPFMLAA